MGKYLLAIGLTCVSLVPLLIIGGRAIYESAKVSSWASIAGAAGVISLLVWFVDSQG